MSLTITRGACSLNFLSRRATQKSAGSTTCESAETYFNASIESPLSVFRRPDAYGYGAFSTIATGPSRDRSIRGGPPSGLIVEAPSIPERAPVQLMTEPVACSCIKDESPEGGSAEPSRQFGKVRLLASSRQCGGIEPCLEREDKGCALISGFSRSLGVRAGSFMPELEEEEPARRPALRKTEIKPFLTATRSAFSDIESASCLRQSKPLA